jgi:pimeloyl-ACP methyl ester carboxylesterase
MPNRPSLVLLPGLLCDCTLWRHQRAALAALAEITVADLTRDDDIDAMAARILSEAPEAFALAGLSMGGYAAQAVIRRAPQRVERLALIDTSYLADSPEQIQRRTDFINLAERGKFKGITPKLLPMLLHPDRLADRELCDTVIGMAENIGKDAFIRQQKAIMSRPDGARDLGRIQCRTLVLCGREDAPTPVDLHEKMAAMIANATLVVVENSGHLSPLEQPAAVTGAMRGWLAGG